MKFKTHIIILVIVVLVLTIMLINGYSKNSNFIEPEHITQIKEKINLDECELGNCEACDENNCKLYRDSCKLDTIMYACGPACDATITFCISK